MEVEQTLNKSQHTELRRKFSCHSCRNSNSQSFDHESHHFTQRAIPAKLMYMSCVSMMMYSIHSVDAFAATG